MIGVGRSLWDYLNARRDYEGDGASRMGSPVPAPPAGRVVADTLEFLEESDEGGLYEGPVGPLVEAILKALNGSDAPAGAGHNGSSTVNPRGETPENSPSMGEGAATGSPGGGCGGQTTVTTTEPAGAGHSGQSTTEVPLKGQPMNANPRGDAPASSQTMSSSDSKAGAKPAKEVTGK
ncbi:MAG: hypothetical protein AB1758_34065 [Candidatus Eremiobacterota bacterium]